MLLKIYLGTVIIAVISLLLVYFRMFLYRKEIKEVRKEIKEVRKENPNKKINKRIDGVMTLILFIIIPILNIIFILVAILNLIMPSEKFIKNMN